MSLDDSLAGLLLLVPKLEALALPPPPVIDRSAALTSPPLPVGPLAIPGLVKLRAAVAKEIAFCEKLLAARGPRHPAADPCSSSTTSLEISFDSVSLSHDSRPRTAEPATNASHLLALYASLAAAPAPVTGINQTFALPLLARRGQHLPQPPARPPAPGSKGAAVARSRNNGGPTKSREIKVNVVCAGGRRWIKVLSGLTVSKLGFELAEDDSYDSDSSASSARSSVSSSSSLAALRLSPAYEPRHARTTLHKTAHALLAARAVLPAILAPPETIELQLPRFTPEALTRLPAEHRKRVEQALDEVRSLPGMDVTLPVGSCTASFRTTTALPDMPTVPSTIYRPTRNVVLDLSLLIALLSGISHMELPDPAAGPEGVFLPLVRQYKKDGSIRTPEERREAMLGGSENVRALTIQLGVEMALPLVDELVAGLAQAEPDNAKEHDAVVCWATIESQQRLRTIVDKLASPDELVRARTLWAIEGESPAEREQRTTRWWASSRHASGNRQLTALHRALADVRLLPSSSPADVMSLASPCNAVDSRRPRWDPLASEHAFGEVQRLLMHLLAPTTPPSSAPGSSSTSLQSSVSSTGAGQKLSPSLTPHTLRTLCAATSRRWTVVTTNRASLLRLWKYWDEAGADPSLGTAAVGEDGLQTAVAWVLEPRSLAESMRA